MGKPVKQIGERREAITVSGQDRRTRAGRPVTRRADAEQVRERILAIAKEQFHNYGYDRTSLAEIGAALGLTRGAVLYHFGSKAGLLTYLLKPFMVGLDQSLDQMESATPSPRPAAVVDVALELLVTTRTAADLLARDVASRHALDLDAWFTTNSTRLVRLLVPTSGADPAAEARGYAALGALIRPLAHLRGPIPDPVRRAVRDAALNALRQPRR